MTTNEQPDDVELVSMKTDDAYVEIDKKHTKKLQEDNERLESLKRGLQAGTDTQHPNKFMAASGAGSHSLSNVSGITDVR